MNLNNDVVYRCPRLGPLHQRHPGRSRSLIRHDDGFHLDTSLYQSSPTRHFRIPAARGNRVRWPGSAHVSRAQTSSGPRTMWTATSSALAPRPAIPPDVNGVQVGEVVPLAGSLDVDQTSRAGGASRRSRQQHMGFRRIPENSGAQVQNLDHMKHSGITQPTARSREA
jgi:hypothetical protein